LIKIYLFREVVNLSARFMQEAIINGPKIGKKTLFLLDETTKKVKKNKNKNKKLKNLIFLLNKNS